MLQKLLVFLSFNSCFNQSSVKGLSVQTSASSGLKPVSVTWTTLTACEDADKCFRDLFEIPRLSAVKSRYARYKAWCNDNLVSNEDYVLTYTAWGGTPQNPRDNIALAPNLAPYNLEQDIEHWVLWHHPISTPPSTRLNQYTDRELVYETLKRAGYSIPNEKVVTFQNPPEVRSVGGIAHSQVFIDTRSDPKLAGVLAKLRWLHEQRSPWHRSDSARTEVEVGLTPLPQAARMSPSA